MRFHQDRKSKRSKAFRKRYDEAKLLRQQSHNYKPPTPSFDSATSSAALPAYYTPTPLQPGPPAYYTPSPLQPAIDERFAQNLNVIEGTEAVATPLLDLVDSEQPVDHGYGATSNPEDVIRAVEEAGSEYAEALIRSGIEFDEVADDDWENELEEEYGDAGSGVPVEMPVDRPAEIGGDTRPLPEIEDPKEENDPDPFLYELPEVSGRGPEPIISNLAVYLLYMLVAWLHTQFHLPFRACKAVLVVVRLALSSVGAVLDEPVVTTLPSVMQHLGIESDFRILPVCPRCQEVYPASTEKSALCLSCNEPLFKTEPTPGQQRRGIPTREDPKPCLQFPVKSISEQLASMLSVPGVEDEMDKVFETFANHQPGQYRTIFDGKVCRELRSADGSLFFSPSQREREDGEMRIGLTMGVDWYRTANLILAGIMPSPKEASPDQVQRYMRPFINELLRLWKDGIRVVTPKFPEGRLVRVALVAVVCDKPAAHKLGGFGSHSHTHFCTMCWISQGDKGSAQAFVENGFRKRTDAEHRRLQKEYLQCTSNSAQDNFVRENATRWAELHRLPYFDLCAMIVIDPMHNLFLGLVKTHFYHIWVQHHILRKNKELKALHGILSQLNLPSKLGRLPRLIGEPAGGSLTADQWLIFATIVAPLAIPQIWQDYLANELPHEIAARRASAIVANLEARRAAARALRERQQAGGEDEVEEGTTKRHRKPTERAVNMDIDSDLEIPDDGALDDPDDPTFGSRAKASNKGKGKGPSRKGRGRTGKKGKNVANPSEDPESTVSNLHPDDPTNFLKLCMALVLVTARNINEEDINRVDELIRDYCTELIDPACPQLYGAS
ncbi:hypothetical protein K435DRAFT_806048, partial [Dendrothele bispora CBS 962.96]